MDRRWTDTSSKIGPESFVLMHVFDAGPRTIPLLVLLTLTSSWQSIVQYAIRINP